MNTFRAGHVPGIDPEQINWLELTDAPCPGLSVPDLTPAQLRTVTATVRDNAARHLRPMPVSAIIERIDRAIHRLLDPTDPARQTLDHWLPRVCELDPDMVRLNLNRYLRTFRARGLHRFVAEDLPNPKVLDEFQPLPKGGWGRAMGPRQLVHLWAGNVPALPLWSLVCGLLVKAGNVGKLASAEPVFATVFARVLTQMEPDWRDALAVVWWQGGDSEREAAACEQAERVIAYGGDETLAALRQRLPSGTHLLAHGHKISFGVVGRQALSARHAPELAHLAAQDVARHDQGGCYSPHVFYVERGGHVSPAEWAERLFHALRNQHARHPRRSPKPEEAYTLAQWRQAHEWGHGTRLLCGDGGDVVLIERAGPLVPGPGLRDIQVVAVDELEQVAACVAPARRWLQTAGLAVTPEQWPDLALALGEAGVTRLCAIGAMTAPEAGWHHDGSHSLRDFLRWVEVEQSLEHHAEHYPPMPIETLAPPRKTDRKLWTQPGWGAVVLAALLLVLWEWGARAWSWSSLILPAPTVVAHAWWAGWSNGFFVGHVSQTLIEVALGRVLGSVFGFAAGVTLGESTYWRRLLLPYVVASQVLPKLALAPLLLLWLGFGTLPLVVITALVCFFPLLENTLTCVRHVDNQSLDLFRLMHASRWQTLWLLKVPAGLPGILTGLRVSLVLAWVGAIVGEFIGATRGLGALIIAAQGSMDTPLMFAVLLNITLLGWLSYQGLLSFEHHALRHREPAHKEEFNTLESWS